MTRRLALALAFALAGSVGALAHHGWGSYDASKTVTFQGKVGSVEWRFPHVHIKMPHEGAEWELVLAPPSRMETRGVLTAMLTVGREVRAEGYASTAVRHEARIERITIEGRTFELR